MNQIQFSKHHLTQLHHLSIFVIKLNKSENKYTLPGCAFFSLSNACNKGVPHGRYSILP